MTTMAPTWIYEICARIINLEWKYIIDYMYLYLFKYAYVYALTEVVYLMSIHKIKVIIALFVNKVLTMKQF